MDQNDQPYQSGESQTSTATHGANGPSMQPTQPQPPVSRRKHKALWVGIAAVVLVLLAAGAVVGYYLWYHSPDKVVADGIMNAVRAKSVVYNGLVSGENNELSIHVEMSGKNKLNTGEFNVNLRMRDRDREVNLEASALAIEKDLYLRIEQPDEFIRLYSQLQIEEEDSYGQLIARLSDKIEGQWIKVDLDQLRENFGLNIVDTRQRCMIEVLNRSQADDRIMAAVASVYEQHQFIEVVESLGVQDGSLGYVLKTNEEKFNRFTHALNDTEFLRQMRECDDTFQVAEPIPSDESTRSELWISQKTREITKLKMQYSNGSEDAFLVELLPQFNQTVAVQAPESSLSFDELKTIIAKVYEEMVKEEEARLQRE